MKISVIVPVFNSAKYLERCLEGLSTQDLTSSEFEVLVIDNNSSDESVSIVEKYPQFKLLHEPKQGAYAARNRGLREARGDIIAFTDSDCVPEPSWLRECLAGFEAADMHIVVGHAYFDHHSWLVASLGDFKGAKETFVLSSDDPSLYYGHTNNMAVKRSTMETIGGFVEWMRGGDAIFVQKTIAKYSCGSVCFRPSMRVRHLEIDSVWQYYKKLFVYGRSQRFYGRVVPARPLTFREGFGVFHELHDRLPLLKRLALLAVLAIGVAPWWAGSASAIVKTRA